MKAVYTKRIVKIGVPFAYCATHAHRHRFIVYHRLNVRVEALGVNARYVALAVSISAPCKSIAKAVVHTAKSVYFCIASKWYFGI